MPRGEGQQTKVHYKGKTEDFIVIVESAQAVLNWKKDKSVPLAQVVDGFKIFVTHHHGAQGVMDTASHGTLDEEFGNHKEDDCIAQILEKGDIQNTLTAGQHGNRNITQGPTVGHQG